MWVKKLQLLNIQSYEKSEVEFSEKINIIIGENNSGKSTIIKSLFKLQNDHSISQSNIRKGFAYGQVKILISATNWGDYMNEDSIAEVEKTTLTDNFVVFHMSNSRITNVYYDAKYEKKCTVNAMGVEQLIDSKGKAFTPIGFNSFTNEEPDNFIYPFLSRRKASHFDEKTDSKTSYNVSSDLRTLPSRMQNLLNPSYSEYNNFITACKEILGFSIGMIPGQNGSNLGIIVRPNEVIPLETMGDGVSNILGLIVILLTERGKLYLIEELENDIHPAALKKLLKLIMSKSDENQFVISTHSNIVLQYLGALKDSKIFKTEWKMENNIPTSVIKMVDNNPEEKRLALEELGYEMYDYNLWKGYLILEESSAEVIIKEFLIPWFAPDLIGKLRLVSANGISKVESVFEDFKRIFVFTHLEPAYKNKSWVIVDGDSDGKGIVEKLKDIYCKSGWKQSNFKNFQKENFEEYFPIQFQKEVSEILTLKGENKKQIKREKKKVLLEEVKKWMNNERDTAKAAFESSAKEVILFLKEIENNI